MNAKKESKKEGAKAKKECQEGKDTSFWCFSDEEVEMWHKDAQMQRDQLFRRRWQNPRNIPDLVSLEAARDFEFVVDWYHESGELMDRLRDIRYYDKLIELGLDVNKPRELQPSV